MAWQYSQSTGDLHQNGNHIATGYAGGGIGRNNPDMERDRDVGPIPRGRYNIGAPINSAQTGPHVLDLTPVWHNAHDRTDFQIHGDNRTNNASNGCIVLPRNIRERISSSGDNTLEVVR